MPSRFLLEATLRSSPDPGAKYARHRLPLRFEGLAERSHEDPLRSPLRRHVRRTLPLQTALSCRITLPWKYGFKSPKSLCKIKFQEKKCHLYHVEPPRCPKKNNGF